MTSTKTFTLEEVKQHNTEKSCWLVIHGKVYDVTPFLYEHPGGSEMLTQSTGKDATRDFDAIDHSGKAKSLLAQYYIGDYEGGDSAPEAAKPAATPAQPAAVSSTACTLNVVLPIVLLAVAVGINYYYTTKKQQ